MRISAAYPSKYLKAADLQGHQPVVTILRVAMENLEGGADQKPVVYFANKTKGLVLNVTNANNIAALYGDETDTWVNQSIQLYEAHVDFQGRTVPAIRVRAPQVQVPVYPSQPASPVSPAPADPAQQGPVDELDDSIPF